MRLDSSGNLGLGVTPSAWGVGSLKAMQIGLAASFSGGATFNDAFIASNGYYDGTNWKYINSNTAYYASVGGSAAARWYTAQSGTAGNAITFSQVMTLDASGNLALGTTSANGKMTIIGNTFDVRNTGGGYGTGYAIEISTNANVPRYNLVDNGAYTGIFKSTSGVVTLSNQSNNALTFETNATERARIDSSGNLLVGTTSTINLAKMVMSFTNSSNGFYLDETSNSSGTQYVRFSQSGTTTGSITRVAQTSAVTYNTTSDYRLKNVIGAVTGHGERLDALEPIDFTWKADGSRTRGFLAHKFQEIYAQSVTGIKDAIDAKGNPEYQAMQAGSAEVIADLVAEIQSLRKRLADAGIA
jgi:hypothetical protein